MCRNLLWYILGTQAWTRRLPRSVYAPPARFLAPRVPLNAILEKRRHLPLQLPHKHYFTSTKPLDLQHFLLTFTHIPPHSLIGRPSTREHPGWK